MKCCNKEMVEDKARDKEVKDLLKSWGYDDKFPHKDLYCKNCGSHVTLYDKGNILSGSGGFGKHLLISIAKAKSGDCIIWDEAKK